LLVILPRLAVYSFRSGPREQTSFRRDGLPTQQSNARIVWILMDELSYDQTFDHRQPDLSLPNFDAFAKQSVSFSNMKPSGFYTEVVVPGLLLGEPIQELKTPVRGQVSFRDVAGGAWHPLDQQSSIFAEAWKLGWNPGVAGWYNPYCRLFPDVLARCSWLYSDRPPAIEVPLSYDKSVTENMRALMPIRSDFKFIFRHPLDNSTHGRDYVDVMKNAEDLLQDQRIRFVFLHLPVPHPPGIYDRTTHRMSSHGSYLDNLVLADDTLGTLIKTLRSTPSYEQTAVIVSSDHSWRTQLWRPEPDWSDEDERVSHGGKFDPRPVLMVHVPGSITGQVIAQPVNEMIVHRILDSLLRGDMQSAADLNQVVIQRPQGPAPVLRQSLVKAAHVAISAHGD
jgi:Sulfatase